MATERDLPAAARVVIVGGGVGAASLAYHLAELGETDVLILERAELTSGSTFHSAGLVGQLRADPTLTRMNMYSVELYRKLAQGEHQVGWTESGGIKLASSPQRMEEIRRQISWARTYGLALHEISPTEAKQMFPLISTEGVVGAAYLASDGYLDPSQLCYALASLARASGVRIAERTRVLSMAVIGSRVRSVRTDRGNVDCEVVVNCGGMFAAEIGRMAGVRIPVVPMSHQYVITEPLLTRGADPLPTLRDPDHLVYFRQEVDALVMGGYERTPAPWTSTRTTFDAIPSDFNGRLLPEDWSRMEELAANAAHRVAAMATVGIRKIINGPEAFTPDNEFCLGETEVAGLYVAAGFCAHGVAGAGGIGRVMAEWIVAGEPSFDVSHMNINRFGSQYRSPGHTLARTVETYQRYYDIPFPGRQAMSGRPLRVSPVYAWHAERGAQFGEKAGWERVDWYESNAPRSQARDAPGRPGGWAGQYWSPAIAAEHRGTRTAAGLFDESSFAKIEVRGPGAVDLLEWTCDNEVAREVGGVTYTQALNRQGGVEADFTVTRTAEDSFLIVTGTSCGSRDISWLRRQAGRRQAAGNLRRGAGVHITDVTGKYACFALWGPRAGDILSGLTPTDLSDDAFAFLTSQEITVADVPLRALRVSFVGEQGWELYPSSEYAAGLWREVWNAGRQYGLVAGGYRAIDSLRLEKGYRVWGTDLTAETNPYEAGLGFCVKIDKPGGFEGAAALRRVQEVGVSRRLRTIVLADPTVAVLGSEPVRVANTVVGRVTSGGIGYSTNASIAYAYLPLDSAPIGADVEVDLFGEWHVGTVTATPLLP
ncbi:MAG: FAD-dependent oxidoreductase [Actinomycetota bacterium]|nr:FAD-dependent oxidoreductase [Actinomycetota bacterium]